MVSHFEAVRVGADAKEVRLLKQETTSLQICLQKEAAIREMQANHGQPETRGSKGDGRNLQPADPRAAVRLKQK